MKYQYASQIKSLKFKITNEFLPEALGTYI